MAEEKHLLILKEGVDNWNSWREKNSTLKPDLSSINYRKADLNGANFRETNLEGAYFFETKLGEVDFSRAKLKGAYLSKAYLRDSYFYKADLREADLSNSDLCDAVLSKANLFRTKLSEAYLRRTDFSEANLYQADLRRAIIIESKFNNSNLSESKVYGISAWKLDLTGAVQNNLIISAEEEPLVYVDNLEVAQFIHLLLNHKKICSFFDSVTKRGVLILGRFSGGGLENLKTIASKLRKFKYLPIIFDFNRPKSRNFTEVIITLTGLSRFVIVDLSGPSVPQELYATVPHFKIPFVPIIEKKTKPFSTFQDFLEIPWVLKPIIRYKNINHLLDILPRRIIEPAERKLKQRLKLLDKIFGKIRK